MHEEVLSLDQRQLLPLVGTFLPEFCLIGGTAVALQLGHRRSIDFDFLTHADLKTVNIREKITKSYQIDNVLIDETNEYTIIVKGVKLTFLKYPFTVISGTDFKNIIKMPDLVSLGAMKAYALGRRAKWKDYIDLYFIFNKYSFKELVDKANMIFGNEFNEKLFREQLIYFDDINYTEKVDFMAGFEVVDEIVKNKLVEISLQKL